MRKPKEIEELIKRAIRDEIALFPLKSVAQVRNALYLKGYQSLRGELDWHYVSRLMKKIRQENLTELTTQSRTERLAILKERHRVVTQKLASILDDKSNDSMDRIAAANSILKWDTSLFFAEEQMVSIGKSVTIQPIVLPLVRAQLPKTHAQVPVRNHIVLRQGQGT